MPKITTLSIFVCLLYLWNSTPIEAKNCESVVEPLDLESDLKMSYTTDCTYVEDFDDFAAMNCRSAANDLARWPEDKRRGFWAPCGPKTHCIFEWRKTENAVFDKTDQFGINFGFWIGGSYHNIYRENYIGDRLYHGHGYTTFGSSDWSGVKEYFTNEDDYLTTLVRFNLTKGADDGSVPILEFMNIIKNSTNC